MAYIPDDILMQAIKNQNDNEFTVLMFYAKISQSEGAEPDIKRLASETDLTLETTENALKALSEKGWLERVKDYSEK